MRKIKSNQIKRIFHTSGSQFKTASLTLPRITGRYHNPIQVDRDKGSREWFKKGANHLPSNQSEKDIMIKS